MYYIHNDVIIAYYNIATPNTIAISTTDVYGIHGSHIFYLTESVYKHIGYISNLVNDCVVDDIIELPISYPIFDTILRWFVDNNYILTKQKCIIYTEEYEKIFGDKYMSLEHPLYYRFWLGKILLAANYLDIQDLINMTCVTIGGLLEDIVDSKKEITEDDVKYIHMYAGI